LYASKLVCCTTNRPILVLSPYVLEQGSGLTPSCNTILCCEYLKLVTTTKRTHSESGCCQPRSRQSRNTGRRVIILQVMRCYLPISHFNFILVANLATKSFYFCSIKLVASNLPPQKEKKEKNRKKTIRKPITNIFNLSPIKHPS